MNSSSAPRNQNEAISDWFISNIGSFQIHIQLACLKNYCMFQNLWYRMYQNLFRFCNNECLLLNHAHGRRDSNTEILQYSYQHEYYRRKCNSLKRFMLQYNYFIAIVHSYASTATQVNQWSIFLNKRKLTWYNQIKHSFILNMLASHTFPPNLPIPENSDI